MKFNHKKSLVIAVALAVVLISTGSQTALAAEAGANPKVVSPDTRNVMLKNGQPPRPELQAQRQQINDLRKENQAIRTDLKAGIQGEREDFRMKAEGMKDQMRNASGTIKQDMRDAMKENRKEMMEKVKSMRQEAFSQAFQNNLQKMNGLGNILTQAYSRLSNAIKQREAAGKDVTEAKKLLAEADTLIKKAQADITAFKNFKPSMNGAAQARPASGTPAVAADGNQVDLEKPRVLAQNVRASIEAAHKALRKVAISLGIGAGNENKPENAKSGTRPPLTPKTNEATPVSPAPAATSADAQQ